VGDGAGAGVAGGDRVPRAVTAVGIPAGELTAGGRVAAGGLPPQATSKATAVNAASAAIGHLTNSLSTVLREMPPHDNPFNYPNG
jgi:hypothetical protein